MHFLTAVFLASDGMVKSNSKGLHLQRKNWKH